MSPSREVREVLVYVTPLELLLLLTGRTDEYVHETMNTRVRLSLSDERFWGPTIDKDLLESLYEYSMELRREKA